MGEIMDKWEILSECEFLGVCLEEYRLMLQLAFDDAEFRRVYGQ